MPRVRRALRKSFTSLLFSSFSPSFLPSYIFFLCSFYNAKASWSFICNSWFFLHDILYFTLKYATWSEVNGKAYVLTEWHMEIWCLDTFSQQQSKVFTKEFLHYLIDSLTLGTSGKTERKREGEGGTKEEKINLHDTSFKSASGTTHILGARQHKGQGWAPTEPRHPQGQS